MSFRHTYITEFLYKHNRREELDKIRIALEEFGSVHWEGTDSQGYFYGVIKDLNSFDTKNEENEITKAIEKAGARLKIVFE